MLAGFSFLHDGRTYTCLAADGPGEPKEPWWWFTVTRDANRYAPFRAAGKDTRATVQARILAYYSNHLEHRAMPESQHWARRPKPGAPGMAGGNGAGGAAAVANRARVAAEVAARVAAEVAAAAPKKVEPPAKPVPALKAVVAPKLVAAPKRPVAVKVAKRPAAPKRVAPARRAAPASKRAKPTPRPAKRVVAKGKARGR